MKKALRSTSVALLGLGALALTGTAASAAIVCNGAHECWHTQNDYVYKPEFGLVIHPNDWKWGAGEKFVWREHEGRGYWRDGVWITF